MFDHVKIGFALVLLGLAFGVGMGISFALNKEGYKSDIARGIEAHPQKHDSNSQIKIWRYIQSVHFFAAAIAAVSFVLLLFLIFSDMASGFKTASSILIGMSSLYPLSWYTIYVLAPSMGLSAAKHHLLTEVLAYLGVGGLVFGTLILMGNKVFGRFRK